MLRQILTRLTDRIYSLPIVILMPHSSCNCRCVMCDIWRANHEKREISTDELRKHVSAFSSLGVEEVVLSGGEALLHHNLWSFCDILKSTRVKITLLTTGLLLEKYSRQISDYIDEVIISVDGSEEVHDSIRRIPNGFSKVAQGIKALRDTSANIRITGRCVLQRSNYFDFNNIVTSAQEIGLERISFLAADIATEAFNHESALEGQRQNEIALTREEVQEFEGIIESSFTSLRSQYVRGFIAERPDKMRQIVQYYKAINGGCDFPQTKCNAPWVSAVIESDGRVQPCFFHKPYGNIFDDTFLHLINSPSAVRWRKDLDIGKDPVCRKCVCTLKRGLVLRGGTDSK
jgi:Fe-coproporphyrin III synthase